MRKLALGKRDSGELLAVDSNVVLVVGAGDVDMILEYARLDTKSGAAGITYSLSKRDDFDNNEALNTWNYLKKDGAAVKLFLSFLKSLSFYYDDVIIKSDGTIMVGYKEEEFSYRSLNDMGEWYKNLFGIALKAFIVSSGRVFIKDINISVRADTYKSLFNYLAKMAAHRNNKTFIGTDNIDAYKGFLQYIQGNADASATLVTMKNNKASNSVIYRTAESEYKAASGVISSLDISV